MVSFPFSLPFCTAAAAGQGDRNCLTEKRTHSAVYLSGLVPASDSMRAPLSAQATLLCLSKLPALWLAALVGMMVPVTENSLVYGETRRWRI